MKVISAPRRNGKTTIMLNMMRENPNIIAFCVDWQEVERLRKDNRDIDPNRFMAGLDSIRHLHGFGGYKAEIFIDNADMLLQSLFPYPVKTISVTED